jgi:hypothetical protein
MRTKDDETQHDRVVRILSQLICDDVKTYTPDEVKAQKKLYRFGPAIGLYMPDVHAPKKGRKDKVDIYEVWCGETREKAYFDIIRALMFPRTGYVAVVAAYNPDYQWSADDVWKIKRTLKQLLAKSYQEKLDQVLVSGCVCELTKEDLEKNDAHIREKLSISLNLPY